MGRMILIVKPHRHVFDPVLFTRTGKKSVE